jgi:6-phosphofructokinase 1
MGRGAGDIALNTAIASGATAVVVPEFPHDDNSICKKIKKARELGKRNFIVIVSEGVGSEYAPALAKKIEAETGVETKFARLAHIVRGGNPTLKDRILASKMGVFAVEELLRGNSNKVICERNGDICSIDIAYSHVIDRMYKGKLKDGDLDGFSPEEIQRMKDEIEEKKAELLSLYTTENKINL